MLMPYSPSAEPLTRLADGTVKQISPFTGTEVWTVPGRANRPISHPVAEVRPLEEADRTHSCAFCSARYLETPPEKARVVRGADGGFGLVPKDIVPAFADAESVETLRNEDDGFNLIATIAHPGGISENYVGMIKGPVVRMQTGNLLRDEISHDYAGSVRLWGLVNGNLMWDWEIADQEGNLHKHASAELRKTSSMTGDSLGTGMFGSLDDGTEEGSAEN